MPNGKKSAAQSRRSRSRMSRGFAEAKVSPGSASKPKKSVITKALNLAERVLTHPLFPLHPALKGLVSPARAAIGHISGYDDRQVHIGSSGESPGVVTTMDAPVAFARSGGVKPSMTYLAKGENGALVHVHDLIRKATTASATDHFNVLSLPTFPTNEVVFPNFADEFLMWEKYRCHGLIFHYCHFTSTASVAAVEISFQSDIDPAEIPTSTSTNAAIENFVMGSCYEDFSLDVSRSLLARVPGHESFLFNDTAGSDDADQHLEYLGLVNLATDENSEATQDIGFWMVEAVFEFIQARPPSLVGSLPKIRRLARLNKAVVLTDDEFQALINKCTSHLVTGLCRERRISAPQGLPNLLAQLRLEASEQKEDSGRSQMTAATASLKVTTVPTSVGLFSKVLQR